MLRSLLRLDLVEVVSQRIFGQYSMWHTISLVSLLDLALQTITRRRVLLFLIQECR
nr:MAG TPA: hypothetical protein [Caudoviricetes sp.]